MFRNFIGNSITLAVLAVMIGIALGFLWALPVMWIWDYIMPSMFGLPEITWFKAWLLCVLCAILFKSHYSREK